MTGTSVVFAENTVTAVRAFHPVRPPRAVTTGRRGVCLETHHPTGGRDHVFADGADLLTDRAAALPAGAVTALRETVERPPPGVPEPDPAALGSLAATANVALTWALHHQVVTAGDPEAPVRDERRFCTVEAQAVTGEGTSFTDVVRWHPDDPAAGLTRVRDAAERCRELAALPVADLPGEPCAVVLDPGYAGAFFHELVGHPLEADVMLSRSSWLARAGHRAVAPAWLRVTEDGRVPDEGFRAGVDDEGVTLRTVDLLRDGRVAEALTDRASARRLGVAANGHGRRLDYRHPAIPRMRHTRTLVEAPAEAPDAARLHPRGLQLRWMNLLTGEFAFTARAALLDTGEGPARRTGPVTLTGHAPDVVAALRPGPAPVRSHGGKADKGCGKLGQFPLPTTFANAGVWLPPEVIGVRAEPQR